MTKNNGGPAFPTMDEMGNFHIPGMTIRDYFAGQALIAIPHMGNGMDLRVEDVAIAAYQQADALLAERDKNVPQA